MLLLFTEIGYFKSITYSITKSFENVSYEEKRAYIFKPL